MILFLLLSKTHQPIQGNICFIGKTSSAGYINAIASEVVLFAEHAGKHSPSSLNVPVDHC